MPTKIRIYCRAYRPFIMGGNVHAMLATTVEGQGPFDLGKGFNGFVVVSPSGQSFVVEAESGGVVGNSIENVRKDIAACKSINLMLKQIVDCKKESKEATTVSNEEYFAGDFQFE